MKKQFFSNNVFLVAAVLFFIPSVINAAYVSFQPHTIEQPNGQIINCYVSGDEYFNWLHDENGYTIIQGASGFFYYGKTDNGKVVPTNHVVNTVVPSEVGLTPWAKISEKNYYLRKASMDIPESKGIKGPSQGNMVNLVVYIRFDGEPEFTTPRTLYDNRFNNPNGESVKNYFQEVSYGQLNIKSYHYPIAPLTSNLSYEDIHPRAYYEPYHSVTNPLGYANSTERRDREHTLLVNAINHVAPQIPDTLNLDIDNDGNVDNVSFIIRGNSGAWAELLWAHRWSLFSQSVYINGKRVWDYTFQPENQTSTYVLCHEMFHVVGAPDLYRYSHDGFVPVGQWDLMATGFVHMGAYMKYKYADQSWISNIPEITTHGTYTLNPITSPVNNAYKLRVPGNHNEYFVFEYRKKEGLYESNIPGSGLLIYRINTNAGNGNAQGPPDEVYLYRPNGTLTQNGQLNQAHFSSNTGRTQFNDYSNPPCFLSNNQLAGIEIFDITAADSTISFTVGIDYRPTASFEALPAVSCNGEIQFVDMSSKIPTSWEWDFGDGHTSTQQNPIHTYSTNGYKTVSLIVSNSHGVDTMIRTNYVRIDRPLAPSSSSQQSCTPTSFTLSASNNFGGTLHWYDQAEEGTLLDTGFTFTTPVLNESASYFVEEIIPPQIENVGPPNNSIGNGSYFNHPNTHYLVFDVHTPITLKSVLVYAGNTKNRDIVIFDNNDNIVHDTTIHLTTGDHRLNLNFDLAPGSGYRIECTTPNAMLFRNSGGTNFPYTISGKITIHGNSASNLSYYYYFYDWEIEGDECISRRRQVNASIMIPEADFTPHKNGLNVYFQNNSSYTHTYDWDFGDGQTSTALNPFNTYHAEGYYDVTLIATGDCGSHSTTKNIAVFFADIYEYDAANNFNVYPNPFYNKIYINTPYNEDLNIVLKNSLGQVVLNQVLEGGSNQHLVPLNHLVSGLYFIKVYSNNRVLHIEKLIKY